MRGAANQPWLRQRCDGRTARSWLLITRRSWVELRREKGCPVHRQLRDVRAALTCRGWRDGRTTSVTARTAINHCCIGHCSCSPRSARCCLRSSSSGGGGATAQVRRPTGCTVDCNDVHNVPADRTGQQNARERGRLVRQTSGRLQPTGTLLQSRSPPQSHLCVSIQVPA